MLRFPLIGERHSRSPLDGATRVAARNGYACCSFSMNAG